MKTLGHTAARALTPNGKSKAKPTGGVGVWLKRFQKEGLLVVLLLLFIATHSSPEPDDLES
jgi:hypothetical protein